MTPTTAVPARSAPGSDAEARRARLLEIVVTVALIAAAAALRCRPLAPHSLWLDDAWVALVSKAHTVGDVRRISVASPGFVAFLSVWFKVVGFSNLRAQLPAFVFGILGPPALYLTARSWRLGRAAALVGGALLLVSPVHMQYSTRVKAYTLEALAAAFVLLVADRLLSDPGRRSRWYAFGAAAAIATVLSAPLAIVCVPGFLAGYVAVHRTAVRIPRAAVGTTAAYGLFGIAWYLVAIRSAINSNLVHYWRGYYISHSSVGALRSSTSRELARLARGFEPVRPFVTLLALAVCLVWMSRARLDRAVLLFGPIFVAAALAVVHRNPFGGGRTDIYLYSNLALALACGANAVFTRIPARTAAAVAMVAIVGLAAASPPVPAYPLEDFRAMLATLDANIRTDDAILLYPKARFAAALYTNWPFHLRGPVPGTSVTTPFDVVITRPLTFVPVDTAEVHFAASVAAATAASPRIWYLGTHGGSGYERVGILLRREGYVVQLARGFENLFWLQLWVRPASRS